MSLSRERQSAGTDADWEALREIAAIERQIRGSSVEGVAVRVTDSGARLAWLTSSMASHFRGSFLASVVTAVANTTHWEVMTVHDPLEEDDGRMQSCLTLQRTDASDTEGQR